MVAEGKAPAGVVGRNSWNKSSWGGPCPPRGEHRYVFKLFALDTTLQLPANAGKPELERAMKGHLIESCELMGLYQRSRS
jgi:Raf kinase inhibitor-like YbhB/YbcL family protein